MDYLYINAVVKEFYKDLPCGCPFPAEYQKTLYSTISNQDCLSNPAVSNVLSFFTLRTKGQVPVTVLSSVQAHTNSAAVARFIQCIGWTWNGAMMLRNLDEVLNAGFYSEDEINETALRGGRFALPRDLRSSRQEIPISMSEKVKQAVLTTVLLRWLRFDPPLRIGVPKNVDYNSYVFSAMKQIYQLFPMSLRAKAGFCSYLPSDKNLSDAISIGFVPEDMADSRTLFLDGSSPAVCAKLNCSTYSADLDTFIQYIANAPQASLADFFEEIYEDMEGSGDGEKMALITTRDYQNIGAALNLLTMDGSLEQLIPQWRKRFFEKQELFSPKMQQRIRAQIRETIDPNEFCRLFQTQWRSISPDVFESLKAYREYCIGNQPLADALWETAVALQLAQKKTYTQIYSDISKRSKDFSFILDNTKQNQLFRQSVEEQLAALQGKAVGTVKDVDSLKAEAEKLNALTSARVTEDTSELQARIQSFLQELETKRNALILADLRMIFQDLKIRPDGTIEEISIRIAEAGQLKKDLAAHQHISGAAALLDEINQYHTDLANKGNDLVHAQLAARFEQLKAQPSENEAQIKVLIDTGNALLADIRKAAAIQKNADLQEKLCSFIQKQEDKIHSSNVKFQRIADIFRSTSQYFRLLLELDKADKSQLEEHHKQTITQELRSRRPATLEQYRNDFDGYFGKPLTLSNVAILPDYVCGLIIRDICQLNKIALRCSRTQRAGESAAKIEGALHTARSISDSCTVSVSYEGSQQDALWFRKLLRLSHDSRSMGDPQEFESVFYDLVEAGAFTGDELLPALEMLNRCGLKFGKLFKALLLGRFPNCSEQQYQLAYEMILLNTNQKPADVLEFMVSSAKKLDDRDRTAYRVFQDFAKAHEPKSSPKKLLIPIICGLGAVIIALIVAVVMLINKGKAPEVPVTTEPTIMETLPAETEPAIVYPDDFLFYGKDSGSIQLLYGTGASADFASRSQKVNALLESADESVSKLILSQYNNSHGTTVVIDDQGTEVNWDEYFFWTCWLYADSDPAQLQEALDQTAPIEQVLSILRVIHHDLPKPEAAEPVPEETEAPAAAETTAPAETEAATAATEVTEAAQADATKPSVQEESIAATEETVPAETVPPITVADVNAVITSAAMGPYEASQIHVEELQLILKLFGHDFQLSFERHAAQVAGLKLTENTQAAKYKHFMKHYRSLPGDSMIRFDDTGIEVSWNEYVFWECWILAQQSGVNIGENTFDGSLHAEVSEILTVIHKLIGQEEYPVNLEELLAAEASAEETEQTQPTEEIASDAAEEMPKSEEALIMEAILRDARAAFEDVQQIYRAIYAQTKAQ